MTTGLLDKLPLDVKRIRTAWIVLMMTYCSWKIRILRNLAAVIDILIFDL